MDILSSGETEFILSQLQSNIRLDGRSKNSFRNINIERDVLKSSSGSCRITFSSISPMEILAGIRVELGTPLPSTPKMGNINVSVKSASILNNREDQWNLFTEDGVSNILASEIKEILSSPIGGIPLSSQSLIKGKLCWNVFVDVVVMNASGSLFEWIMVTVREALKNTKFPPILVTTLNDMNTLAENENDTADFEVSLEEDSSKSLSFNVDDIPLFFSIAIFDLPNIQNNQDMIDVDNDFLWVLDTTVKEESCPCIRFTCGVQKDGTLVYFRHKRGGLININQVEGIIKTAAIQGEKFWEIINKI